MLQPLVENAIYHGIKEIDRPGLIRVTTEVSGDSACVSIFDNGRGFDRSESTDQTLLRLGGVGLNNVDQRLHLQFGEAYHMEIDSKAFKVWLLALNQSPYDRLRQELKIVGPLLANTS